MLCVSVDQNGVMTALLGPCTASEYVLLTSIEAEQLTKSPFVLSTADGVSLSIAIIGVWGAAFAFRAIVKTLNSGEPEK